MGENVIDDLEREWGRLSGSPAMAEALRRWGEEEPLLRFASLAELVRTVERRDADPDVTDAILGALARRARHEPEAARVLLQLLLPGCKALVRRYPFWDRQDGAASVVALAWDRIRTYPIERRPAKIAANVLGDVRQRLLREWTPTPEPVDPRRLYEDVPAPVVEAREPAVEAVTLLGWAVRQGHLRREAAHLIVLTRLAGVRLPELATAWGTKEGTLRRRRVRAEQRVRELVAS